MGSCSCSCPVPVEVQFLLVPVPVEVDELATINNINCSSNCCCVTRRICCHMSMSSINNGRILEPNVSSVYEPELSVTVTSGAYVYTYSTVTDAASNITGPVVSTTLTVLVTVVVLPDGSVVVYVMSSVFITEVLIEPNAYTNQNYRFYFQEAYMLANSAVTEVLQQL